MTLPLRRAVRPSALKKNRFFLGNLTVYRLVSENYDALVPDCWLPAEQRPRGLLGTVHTTWEKESAEYITSRACSNRFATLEKPLRIVAD